jgi:serine/threonine protein kinase
MLGYLLYACGRNGLPRHIEFEGRRYDLREVLKHDFFAGTALYASEARSPDEQEARPAKIVLKLSRRNHLLGLPLSWLGERISAHEISILRRLAHLQGTPRLLSRYGKTGFIYEYIEGHSLKEQPELPDDFFDQLLELLLHIHQRNVVYLDMNKRSNILVGTDGSPHLIDFQISTHIGEHALFSRRLSNYLRQALQQADIYHLFKHKRRLSPDLLSPQEKVLSHQMSGLIRAHRLVATPLREFRRALLRLLYARGLLVPEENGPGTCETEPSDSAK